MSAEEAVTEGLQKPIDQNAQSAEDAKAMLAQLQGEAEKPNGTAESHTAEDAVKTEDKALDAAVAEPKNEEHNDEGRAGHREGRGGHRGGRGGSGRGRGAPAQRSFRDNIKSDLTTQQESSDPVAIRKQIEFYFSDSNLPMDKFLLGKVGGSKNIPVEIKILHSFKRMRHFQPFEAIVEALKESTFLELTDNNTCVVRREPLPEALNDGPDPNAVKVFEDRAMPRSVYVKGFGDELPSTQFDIEAFFTTYGPTNAIRLRRSDTKVFKGSVFVEFESEDLQRTFLDTDPKPMYKGKDLQIMSKKQYCDQKVEDIKSGKIRPNNAKEFAGRRNDNKGGKDFKRKRDDKDDRDWRDRRDGDRKNGGSRNDRGRGRDSRGGRGGRHDRSERDERGVPTVKATTEEEMKTDLSKRDAAKADALAKARAIVEAENQKTVGKQSIADNVESSEQEVKSEVPAQTAHEVAASIQADVQAVTGTKREREDDTGVEEHPAKKVDV